MGENLILQQGEVRQNKQLPLRKGSARVAVIYELKGVPLRIN